MAAQLTATTTRAIRECALADGWRRAVFGRDGHACRSCRAVPSADAPLHAHHLKPFAEILREHGIASVEEAKRCAALWDAVNGVTLCRGCHQDAHRNGATLVLGEVVLSAAAVDYRRWWSEERPDVPYGSCWCGCGESTAPAKQTATALRHVKGEPVRFVRGHGNTRGDKAEHSVEDRGHETPCWVWLRSINGDGYPQLRRRDGKALLAYRAYYEREYGPLRPGTRLLRACGVRACVRPSHQISSV